MRNSTFIFALFIFILSGCSSSDSSIANKKDYEKYLQASHLEEAKVKLNKEIDFWNDKLKASPNNHIFQTKLAGLYAGQYKLTGNVQQLLNSDELLLSVNKRIPNQVGILQTLAGNAITRHAFRAAEKYAEEAYEIGESKDMSSLMRADVALERGQMYMATKMLKDLTNKNEFNYLIRNVKLKDHEGDLTSAIDNMEQALAKAKKSGNSSLINWSLSNLADMYGHDGRIEKSYNTYLAALAENPADLHSLKGIAWVLFSHDKNTEAAMEITHFLKSIHSVPDYDLQLAKMLRYENKIEEAKKYEQLFLAEASKADYGKMYKSYICLMKVDNKANQDAFDIAEEEIEERPSPVSYDLLAWTTLHQGQAGKAAEIVEQFVIGKTEEPMTLFHRGVILKEAGKVDEAKKYLAEALDASYELGPLITQKVEGYLKEI